MSGGREDSTRYSYTTITTARVPEGWLVAIDDLHKHEWRNEGGLRHAQTRRKAMQSEERLPLGIQLMNVQRR